jgi:hypothetical protein
LAAAAAPSSPPPIGNPDQAGQELAARLRSTPPAESRAFTGVLKITPRGGPTRVISLTCMIRVPDAAGLPAAWETTYRTAATGETPQETLCVRSRAGRPPEYLHARGRAAGGLPDDTWRVTGAQLETPLAGSDFWLCDLGLEFLHWPTQRVVRAQMMRSRPCRVLESVNAAPTTNGYARVLSWVDNEEGALLQAEAYDRAGKLVKEFSLGSFKKVDGQWQLQDMRLRHVRAGSRTWLEFDLGK